MEIKMSLTDIATRPKYPTKGAAGLELFALQDTVVSSRGKGVRTGVAVAIPEGYIGMVTLLPHIVKQHVRLCAGVLMVDSDFRGRITPLLKHDDYGVYLTIEKGACFAQLIVVPCPRITYRKIDRL